MGRIQTKFADLWRVFSAGGNRQLNAKLARLCVLYEDLRIEMLGIAEPSIRALDVLNAEEHNKDAPEQVGKYRRYYFLRRSIVTVCEFSEALRLIKDDPALQFGPDELDQDAKVTLSSAIAFFETNEALLKAIRNDLGGHFGQKAALNAIDRLSPNSFSAIELVDGKDLRLRFAGEIAANALLPHLNHNVNEYSNLLKTCVKPAYQHATRCVQILVAKYLWPTFGK